MNTSNLRIVKQGVPPGTAQRLLVLLHGRGASPNDILGLSHQFPIADYAVWAPEAPGGSWYPQPFTAAPPANEPWLSQSLAGIEGLVAEAEGAGIARSNIVFGGFSQGASLAQEFLARSGGLWGGLIALSGGLIGDKLYIERYPDTLSGTKVFIGSSDPDPYIPVERVRESAAFFESKGARVKCVIYPAMGHRISPDEIAEATRHVFSA